MGLELANRGRTAQHDIRPRSRQCRGERQHIYSSAALLSDATKRLDMRCKDAVAFPISVSEPAIGQCLLDHHPHPGGVRITQRRLGASLKEIPGRLNGIEDPLAVATHVESLSNGDILPRPADGQSCPDPLLSQ